MGRNGGFSFSGRLYWYVTKEVVSLTLVIMAALSSVMFLFRILRFADYIFISEEGLLSILMFVLFLLPAIFKLTVPISLLLATTVVVLRMSADRELEGWMSVGVSPLRLAVGPVVVGLLVCGLSAFSALWLEPFSRQEWSRFKYMHARKSVEGIIENRLQEKTFLSELFRTNESDIAFYVDKLGADKSAFQGVFLALTSKSGPHSFVLVAREGSLRKTNDGGITDYVITLREGRTYQPAVGRAQGDASFLKEMAELSEAAALTPTPTPTPTASPQGDASPGALAPPGGVSAAGAGANATAGAAVAAGGDFPSASPGPSPSPSASPIATPTPLPWSQRYVYPRDWTVADFKEMRISLLNMFAQQFDPGEFDGSDIRSRYPVDYWRELKRLRASEEWGRNQRLVRDHSFFYEQIVVPLSCLLLPIIGVCLGIQDPRRKAGLAYLGLGLVVFAYYASIMVCQQLALRYVFPPEVTLFVPPVVITLVAGLLVHWRLHYPPSVRFVEYLGLEFGLRPPTPAGVARLIRSVATRRGGRGTGGGPGGGGSGGGAGEGGA